MKDVGFPAGHSGNSNYGSNWSSDLGSSVDASWDNKLDGGDWSNKVDTNNAWGESGGSVGSGSGGGGGSGFGSSNSGSGSSYSKEESVKYIIIEKEQPSPSYSESSYPSSIGFPGSPMSGSPMSGSPFSGASSLPSSLVPGSHEIVDTASYPGAVIHVPLVAPGQPKYCVRCRILSCPTSCERVDSHGCHSCPCAPSRFVTNQLSPSVPQLSLMNVCLHENYIALTNTLLQCYLKVAKLTK